MNRVAVPLAAVLALVATLAGGCGGGAEPGAPKSATLVLDFQPNAVHAGIYAALARGYYGDEGVELSLREPSASTDAPKLLQSGRAELAILDIHDLGLAVERGLAVAGVSSIVGAPLAAVLVRPPIARPRELEGRTVGVTGLPSDDAVLESVVAADGGDPARVDRVTIGFNAVAALAGGRVDGATAFWSAEGVALARRGIEVRDFRVDDYGAPRYPELVLVAPRRLLDRDPGLVRSVVDATRRGYEAVLEHPDGALDDLLAAVPALERDVQRAQLDALLPVFERPGRLDARTLAAWQRWDVEHGILARPGPVGLYFDRDFVSG